MEKYGNKEGIRFVGGIYDFEKLNSVRYYSFAYFHGHSVGGTNPSLLEAMASSCYILANDNIFNRAVLKKNAEYYKDSEGVKEILNHIERLADRDKVQFIRENLEEIRKEYSWEHLVDEHEAYFNWVAYAKTLKRMKLKGMRKACRLLCIAWLCLWGVVPVYGQALRVRPDCFMHLRQKCNGTRLLCLVVIYWI